MRYRLILKRLPLVALVGLALGLALQGKALAQQEPQITSVFKSVVLTDPKDSGWRNVPSAELPLTPQVAIKPALSTGTVSSLPPFRTLMPVTNVSPTMAVTCALCSTFTIALAVTFSCMIGSPVKAGPMLTRWTNRAILIIWSAASSAEFPPPMTATRFPAKSGPSQVAQ